MPKNFEQPPPPPSPMTSSSSSCVVAMPPSAPRGRVTLSRSSSRLSAVLPRPFRRRPRTPDVHAATLPPAQQPLLSVAGRPCSPYGSRHWYDPGHSRTLPWNSRQRTAAAARATARTPDAPVSRQRFATVDSHNGGLWHGQCNGSLGRRARHSTDRLETWIGFFFLALPATGPPHHLQFEV